MITSQMVGPVAILDRAQKAIITEILVVTPERGIELAAALTKLYHAEDYLLHVRCHPLGGRCIYSDLVPRAINQMVQK